MSDLEARVLRLERSNLRLRRAISALLALAAIPLLAAYVPANDKIEAAELSVRDKGGVVRARIYVDEQGKTRLVLRDRDGRSTAVLLSGDGASLSLGDKDGKASVVVSAPSPSTNLMVIEREGKPRTILTTPPGPTFGTAKDPLDAQDPWAQPE